MLHEGPVESGALRRLGVELLEAAAAERRVSVDELPVTKELCRMWPLGKATTMAPWRFSRCVIDGKLGTVAGVFESSVETWPVQVWLCVGPRGGILSVSGNGLVFLGDEPLRKLVGNAPGPPLAEFASKWRPATQPQPGARPIESMIMPQDLMATPPSKRIRGYP